MPAPRWIHAALLATLLAAPALAHPGSAIAVDRQGQVYFLDTGSGPYKIDAKGALVRLDGPRFHWLTLDLDDRYKSTSLPSGASGDITRVGSTPTLLVSSDYPVAVGPDGNLYHPRRLSDSRADIVRLLPSGATTVLASLSVPNVGGMAFGPDATLYVTTRRSILRIDAKGQVTTFAANVSPSECASIPGTEPNDSLRGLAVDAAGTVYAAASACGAVLKISPDGKVTKVLQLEAPWSPTAVALSGQDLYVQEYLHTPGEDRRSWLPRVRKISADGKSAVIATVSR
jgi:SMP-30/gluconolaconase/LRE-like protein